MRDGDRWAEVRSDDRGRELRMAERHAERHVDETGTQLRIVDRWSTVREERIPGTSDWSPAPETRAERRRRAEHDDRDETYPAAARAELPGPRHAPDDVRAERSSGNTGRGWRDVRSGVIEPDHSDGYEDSRYERPSHDWSAYDSSARDRSAYDRPAYDRPAYDRPAYDSAAHDDVGIYRRRSDERPAPGRAPALDVRPDPNAAGWTEDRTAGRRESLYFPPSRRDSVEIAPPNRR